MGRWVEPWKVRYVGGKMRCSKFLTLQDTRYQKLVVWALDFIGVDKLLTLEGGILVG